MYHKTITLKNQKLGALKNSTIKRSYNSELNNNIFVYTNKSITIYYYFLWNSH